MHEIICPWIQYMNLLHFLFKEEVALKVFIWERKNKDISVKTRTFARPLNGAAVDFLKIYLILKENLILSKLFRIDVDSEAGKCWVVLTFILSLVKYT